MIRAGAGVAREHGAAMEQPGDHMHQPRCRLQRFACKADLRQRVAAERPQIALRSKGGVRLVGEQHRLDIEIFDLCPLHRHVDCRHIRSPADHEGGDAMSPASSAMAVTMKSRHPAVPF